MKLGTRNICEPYIRELLGKISAISELYTYIGTDRPNRYMGSFFPYYGHKHGVEILTNRFNALYKDGSATLDKMIAEIEDIDFDCSNNDMDSFLCSIRKKWQYVANYCKETLDEISIYTDEEREEKLKIVEAEYGSEITNKIRYRVTKENLISEFKRSQSIFLDIKQIAQSGNQVKVSSKESEEFTINSERLKSYFKVKFLNSMEGDDFKIDLLIQDLKQYGELYDKKKHAALAYILYDYVLKPNSKQSFASWLKIYSECCSVELSTYKKSKLKDTKKTLEETQFSYLIPSKSPQ